MIRVMEQKYIATNFFYNEFAGLSTDTKPVDGVATGSVFVEVDTGKVYLFDEVGKTWTEVSA